MKWIIVFLVTIFFEFLVADGNYTRIKRAANNNAWPNGIVPYEFKPDFPAKDRAMFHKAAKYIEERSCIRFKPKSSVGKGGWLDLVLGGCCSSYVGRISDNKGQAVTMGSGLILPFYLHELGHALGFPHEQDRPDRDEYIRWDKQKKNSCNGGFADKYGGLNQAAADLPFDYVSLMADWNECYWPQSHTPKEIPLGAGGSDHRTLSVLDFEKINAMHNCKGCYGYRFRKITQLGGNANPFPAGHEVDGRKFYICRVYHEGHIIVGKSTLDRKECFVGFHGGERKYTDNYWILTNPGNSAKLKWVHTSRRGREKPIKGGRTKDRETIYIGRCLIRGDRNSMVPGFFLESNPRELFVPYGGGVRKCTDFEVLVC